MVKYQLNNSIGHIGKITVDARGVAKRRPQQARSQETVERILLSARAILENDGIEALNTNRIADHANISVASIYQFFSNKLAIITELYRLWLADVDMRVDAAIIANQRAEDWRIMASAIAEQLSSIQMSSQGELALMRAMWSHKELLEMDRQRLAILAKKIANTMVQFDKDVDFHQAELVASFANEAFTLVAYIDFYDDPVDRKDLNAIAQQNYLNLWEGLLGKSGSHRK